MATCQIESFYVPDVAPGEYHVGISYPAKAVTLCRTHNWGLTGSFDNVISQCPIGRIEQAADEAIARINAASTNLNPNWKDSHDRR